MVFSDAPIGRVPSWLRPMRVEPPKPPRPAPPPVETLPFDRAPAPEPALRAEPETPAPPTAAQKRAARARWERRWRACPASACRRERRCRFTVRGCGEQAAPPLDPDAMGRLYKTLKWKLGEGPKPPDRPEPPAPPPPRRRRRGTKRRGP